jgi:radical SAM protein with 4Fe4S-binding SPASM domain
MDVEGKFHMCESINNRFTIGDVWRGFDFDRMLEISKEFSNIKKNYCSNCDIKYLCRPCYVIFSSDGKLEFDKKFCNRYKKSVIKNLREKIRFEEDKISKNEKDKIKIFRFHQFITVVKGPVNTALVDFINGDIYHVQNKIIEHFENREYEKIPEFIKAAREFGLIIYVYKNTWITKNISSMKELKFFDEIGKKDIVLCIEEGADISLVKNQVSNFNINQIIFYGSGSQRIENLFQGFEIIYEDSDDYLKCSKNSIIKKDDFVKIDEEFYNFSQVCNNCLGHKISITKDGKIRPCIHSNIIIDDLKNLNNPETIEKIKSYWYITKDKVEKCKECELRYFCIDCRELAQRESNGNLYATNPNCRYDPNTGVWQEDE